jgi:DNA adenine methylase
MANVKQNKPPFGYFGSKFRLASKLVAGLPPHKAWVEAFCGSAALTLAKAPAPIEIINDVDDQIANLFQQLRQEPKELLRQIALTPYARSEYLLTRHLNSNEHISDLEKARRFLVSSMMSINGVIGKARGGFSVSPSYSRGGMEARVSRWYNLPARLEQIVERLRSVRIEKSDARKLFRKFLNRPATLIYLDPPYLYDTKKSNYRIDDCDHEFHKELLELANTAKCMVFISGYDSELYSSTLRPDYGWTRLEIDTTTRAHTGVDFDRTEIVWMNKHFTEAQRSGVVPIELSEFEKQHGKLNPERA